MGSCQLLKVEKPKEDENDLNTGCDGMLHVNDVIVDIDTVVHMDKIGLYIIELFYDLDNW